MPRKRHAIEDPPLRRAREILAVTSPPSAATLTAEYAALAASYELLLRRLHKTLVISDSYQTQLRDLNENLCQRIEEETLRRLNQEHLLTHHAKLAAMGEMIDAIAHQWQQPLATLSVLVQTMREAHVHGRLDDTFLEGKTVSALAQISYMTETIATFRRFFRPDKEQQSFSVPAKVAEAGELLRSQLTATQVSLKISAAPGDNCLRGFPNEFIQIIVNLLANACEAIRLGGTSDARPGEIVVNILPEEYEVAVEVADNGPGIPPETAGRIFEPDFTTKKSGSGTGMGLYMSRLLVEQSMGGTISFTSTPGRTCFRLELPRDGSQPASSA